MEILRSISLYIEGKDMPFMVIGGHAVNIHGISRQTGDLDILVPLRTKSCWQELMGKLRYVEGQSDDRFSRFRAGQLDNWPIDIMYVDDNTFNAIYKDCTSCDFGQTKANVISLKHLVILKLHALKHYQEHRFAKDYTDLVALLKKSGESVANEDFKQKCLKYAGQDIYDRLKSDNKVNQS